MEPLDLSPELMECMRCRELAHMRFYGLCTPCREELHERFRPTARTIEVADYEPKMNVTPNAVALREE